MFFFVGGGLILMNFIPYLLLSKKPNWLPKRGTGTGGGGMVTIYEIMSQKIFDFSKDGFHSYMEPFKNIFAPQIGH